MNTTLVCSEKTPVRDRGRSAGPLSIWRRYGLVLGLLPVLMLGLLNVAAMSARADTEVAVPAPLQPWRDWALHGEEFRRCPLLQGRDGQAADSFVCAWYGRLELKVGADSAEFSLQVELLREEWLLLPGSQELWPHSVSANGQPLTVVAHQGRPAVLLKAGQYPLKGRFSWGRSGGGSRPAQLMLPSNLVLLALELDGKTIVHPQRDGDALWLGRGNVEASGVAPVQDALEVSVYRRLQDGLPFSDETVIELQVSGRARELRLGQPLLPGFVAMGLSGDLAARWDEQKGLSVQVLPGHWRLKLTSRASALPTQIALPAPAEAGATPWPAQEIWSLASDERLRSLSFSGGNAIDPKTSGVPAEWLELPAVRMAAGDALTLSERARGQQAKDNALHWQRQLWLNFDGSAYRFLDQISGQMRSEWRLSALPELALQQAESDGQPVPITRLSADGGADLGTGIELRQAALNVRAGGEIGRDATTASGWATRFESGQITLHLPPGYRLFGATGVDSASDSFIARWDLLDGFIWVLLIALGHRLAGRRAAFALALASAWFFHEPGFPYWLLLNALAVLLLLNAMRALQGGAAQRLCLWLGRYRTLSVLVLVLALLPFAADTLRTMLHPQLEQHESTYGLGAANMARGRADAAEQYAAAEMADQAGPVEASPPEVDAPMTLSAPAPAPMMEKAKSRDYSPPSPPAPKALSRYAQQSLQQAGKGRPDWRWRSHVLSWQGPVTADQALSLWVLPYWANALLQGIGLLLLVWTGLLLAGRLTGRPLWRWPAALNKSTMSALPVLVLTGVLSLANSPVQAETSGFPSPELLTELKTRLLAPPLCAPACAELGLVRLRLDTGAERLVLELEAQALTDSAMAIPGRPGAWLPDLVERDGQRVGTVLLNGELRVRLPRGAHTLRLSGPIPASDRFSLHFPQVPRRVQAELEGWQVLGLDGERLPSAAIELVRLADKAGTTDKREGGSVLTALPYVRVHRRLELGLDWQVLTTVERLAPTEAAFSIKLPLLPGETASSADLDLKGDELTLHFAAGEAYKQFAGVLARQDRLHWTMADADKVNRSERWTISASNQWRVEHEGTPLLANDENAVQGEPAALSFAPRPGEQLALTIAQPQAEAGTALAIDSVAHNESQGARALTGTLTYRYRATIGGEQVLRWPVSARVTELTVDGVAQGSRPAAPEAGAETETATTEWRLNVLPGEHQVQIAYQTDAAAGLHAGVAAIDLGTDAANLHTGLTLPEDRWLLAVNGPRVGPAVLYWSALLVFIAVAFAISRSGATPLRFGGALLLGLGLSTVSWWALAIIVGWMLVMNWRARMLPERLAAQARWRFNLGQFALLAYSLGVIVLLMVLVPQALLSEPDMMLTGNNSYGHNLYWFADQSAGALPTVAVWSLPLWCYQVAMLAWAIWLSLALLGWLRWAWTCLQHGGFWRPAPAKTVVEPVKTEIESAPAGPPDK